MKRSIEDRLMTGDADPGMYPEIAERLGMFPQPEPPTEGCNECGEHYVGTCNEQAGCVCHGDAPQNDARPF